LFAGCSRGIHIPETGRYQETTYLAGMLEFLLALGAMVVAGRWLAAAAASAGVPGTIVTALLAAT
jgi:hypothetical protein